MKKKRKGFTLVELLVVIAIIALLMGILMPALARVRAIAYRVVCGTNLSGLGKAMLIYANDHEEEFPQAGGVGAVWATAGRLPAWDAGNRIQAYSLGGAGTGGHVTVASSLYLLVKYVDVGPKQFLCKGTDTTEFKLEAGAPFDLIDVWDFGREPIRHCSYSYHHAVNDSRFALSAAGSQPSMAVAADRNPWLDPVGTQTNRPQFKPDIEPWNGTSEEAKAGNAYAHGGEGQNVLFLDGHVSWEKRSFCGVQDDNIYRVCNKRDEPQLGMPPPNPGVPPAHKEDSLLVNEGEGGVVTTTPGPKPGPCFPADTPVWVDGALLQISKVIPGQKVGKPLSAGVPVCLQEAVCLKEIEMVQEHDESEGPFECYDIVLETGNRISVVDSHYFLVDSGRWVLVQNLTSGSKLVSLKGPISVSSVVKRAMPYVGKVYNLKVKSGERYFVGKDGVAVRDY